MSFHGERCQLSYENAASTTGFTTATILAPFTPHPEHGHFIHPTASVSEEKVPIPSDFIAQTTWSQILQGIRYGK